MARKTLTAADTPAGTFGVAELPATREESSAIRTAAFSGRQWVLRSVRSAFSVISPLGRSVIVIGVVAWIAGALLGWDELLLAAATCLLVLAIAVLFVLGKATIRTDIELSPARLVAGERAAGRLRFSNPSSWRTVPLEVELPVGRATATFHVPSLSPRGESEELLVIPTDRRGVITIGPATAVRGDPLGLLHRHAGGGGATELLVHPKTVPLPSFGAGVLRDLEGLTTKEVSASDLAFHSLRDYAPGDDRRFIHWRSSAKTAHLQGQLQVRQFYDTRRSSLTLVVDTRPASYGDPDEFEVALQVAGSLAVRAVRDGLQAMLMAGAQVASTSGPPYLLLDALARAALTTVAGDLRRLAARAAQRDAGTTLAVIISGSAVRPAEFRRAAVSFPSEVRTVGIRIVPGEPWSVGAAGMTTVIQLGEVLELAAVVGLGAVR